MGTVYTSQTQICSCSFFSSFPSLSTLLLSFLSPSTLSLFNSHFLPFPPFPILSIFPSISSFSPSFLPSPSSFLALLYHCFLHLSLCPFLFSPLSFPFPSLSFFTLFCCFPFLEVLEWVYVHAASFAVAQQCLGCSSWKMYSVMLLNYKIWKQTRWAAFMTVTADLIQNMHNSLETTRIRRSQTNVSV